MAFLSLLVVCCLPLILSNNLTTLAFLLISLSPFLWLSARAIPVAYQKLFRSISSGLAIILAIPIFYFLLQVLPVPFLAHPAWASVASALQSFVPASISVDKGATILCFCNFCAFCGLFFGVTALAMTRANAESLLIVSLLVVTAFMLDFLLRGTISNPDCFGSRLDGGDFALIATAGLVFSVSAAIDLSEKQSRSERRLNYRLIAWTSVGICVAVCVISLIRISNSGAVAASAGVFVVFILVVLVRRLGIWAGAAPVATVLVVAAILVADGKIAHPDLDVTLKFYGANEASLSTVQRMIEDAPGFGSGAATFCELAQLYDSPDNLVTAPLSAVFAVEMGKWCLWVAVISLFMAIVFFLIRAVVRGRSWVHPAAAASLLCAGLILAFSTSLELNFFSSIVCAIGLGLGVGQSFSRSSSHAY